MRLLRSFPVAVFTLVLVAIVGFCAAERSVTLLLVAGAIAAISWYVTEGPRGRTIPRWASNILVLAISLSVVWDVLEHKGDIFGVLGRFATWLTLVKLYERRTARDHAHLLALSLLLMLVGCLKSADLVFGIVMLMYIVLGLYVLLLYQLYAAHEAASATRRLAAPVEGLPAPSMRPIVGRHLPLQFRGTTVVIGVVVLAVSLVVFLGFPRNIARGAWATDALINPLGRTSGYSGEIDLVSGTRVSNSRRPVLDVQLLGADGIPVQVDPPLLLRGSVLDRYEDGAWTGGSSRDARRMLTAADGPTPLGSARLDSAGLEGRLVRARIRSREPSMDLFGLYLPVAVETPGSTDLSYSPSAQTLSVSGTEAPLRTYTVVSHLDPSDDDVRAAADRTQPSRRPPRRFRGAEGQRIRAYAVSILEAAGLPERYPVRGDWRRWNLEAAEAFAEHLRSEYRYTLDRSDIVLADQDPIEEFLFESRAGHCEFFASALVALCQTVSIDARVVTGYAASQWDPDERVYQVSAGNAHAWAEVRTGRYRYTPVDPTPPAAYTTTAGDDAGLTERIGWFYERLEGSWTGAVISYDQAAQRQLLSGIDTGWAQRASAALQEVRDWAADVNRRFNLGPSGYIWLGIVALAIVLIIVVGLTLYHRARLLRRLFRRRRRSSAPLRVPWGLGFYLDMQAVLRRAGLIRPEWQTPLAYGEALVDERPDAGAMVVRLTTIYYSSRFGGRTLAAAEVAEAKRLVKELASTLRVRA